KKAGGKPLPAAAADDRAAWEKLVGIYESDGGARLALTIAEPGLMYQGRWLKPTGPDTFVPLGSEGLRVRVARPGHDVAHITRPPPAHAVPRGVQLLRLPQADGTGRPGGPRRRDRRPAAQLAVVPRAGRHRCRRRPAAARHLGPQRGQERPLENADPRAGTLQP